MRSIQIVGVEEKISRFELDKRLRENTIEVGTELHSPKHGKLKVQMLDNALVLINEREELVK